MHTEMVVVPICHIPKEAVGRRKTPMSGGRSGGDWNSSAFGFEEHEKMIH